MRQLVRAMLLLVQRFLLDNSHTLMCSLLRLVVLSESNCMLSSYRLYSYWSLEACTKAGLHHCCCTVVIITYNRLLPATIVWTHTAERITWRSFTSCQRFVCIFLPFIIQCCYHTYQLGIMVRYYQCVVNFGKLVVCCWLFFMCLLEWWCLGRLCHRVYALGSECFIPFGNEGSWDTMPTLTDLCCW